MAYGIEFGGLGGTLGRRNHSSTPSLGPGGGEGGDIYSNFRDFGNQAFGALSPAQVDLSGVKAAQERAFKTQDQLAAERAGYAGYFNPGNEADIRGRQTGALDMLGAAAAGRVPSPAELQLQQQAARNAAAAYGLSAALQGRSPGGALRMAQQGATATQAGANADAAILRAKETADARQAYINALAGVRSGDQNLLGADLDWRKALLMGQLGALGAGTTAAGNEAQAKAAAAGGANAFKGGLISGGANILTHIIDPSGQNPGR